MNKKLLGAIGAGITAAVAVAAKVAEKKAKKTTYTAELMEPIEAREKSFYERHVKRPLDVVCATGALVCLSPVYAGVALAVKLKLGSPVLFTQDRPGMIGEDGKETIFKMYKFRTMTDERDENGELLPDEVRLTKFGAWLRSTSLDELPEAINILNGTMSVIGPRPQLVRDMVFMSKEQRARHTAKPGLSGLAQVNGRNAISWDEKLEWDQKYVENISFLEDLKLVANTVNKTVKKEGITEEKMATAEDYGDYLLRIDAVDFDNYTEMKKRATEILLQKKEKKNIWLINHYAVPPEYYPLARPTNFAKYLQRMGHEVVIFAASTVHNSDQNLIDDGSAYKEIENNGIRYVLINCKDYSGNGIKRIGNMCEFAMKLPRVCRNFKKPDVIVATSMPPMSCAMGIKLAKKYGCKGLAEIADLWPESIVAYDIAKPNNPAVIALRYLEKWIYKNADKVIFTMEGAYDYIIEQGWEDVIPRSKIEFINNGVDLEVFNYNKEHFRIRDDDLDNANLFKVVYTGSIRKVNNLGKLLDVAKLIQDSKIKLLIWGDGDELPILRKRIEDENIDNVVLKGRVEKNFVPYIISKSDLNIMHGADSSVLRFGLSANKLFDYLAAGKPILTDYNVSYNPAEKYGATYELKAFSEIDISNAIIDCKNLDSGKYVNLCKNAVVAAKHYDFATLTVELIRIINSL